jgi:hypothetical protein
LLGFEGRQFEKDLWESCVYLGTDGHVYHLIASVKRGERRITVSSKRSVGEYLRWVDSIFDPGQVPDESKGVHYRAARALRELI